MKIAAIARNPQNSPNMAENDFSILKAVAILLEKQGNIVDFIEEKEFSTDKSYEAIIHMTRTASLLKKLAIAEQKGIKVYNSTDGVKNCSRKTFTDKLQQHAISQPRYIIMSTNQDAPQTGYPMWLKKSEGWSCHPCDICHVHNPQEAEKAMKAFAERGVTEILCTPHIAGDIIKFYGVKGGFFHWYYPNPERTKFSLERFNGERKNYPFDTDALKKIAFDTARILQTDIFGGDCIITPQSEIILIDINDFPSYSACRDKAAAAIAEFIQSEIIKK